MSESSTNQTPNTLTIYTDGGCEPNPGKGCWSFYCVETKYSKTGWNNKTTNNVMEMMGVIEAIKYAQSRGASVINIKSDSQYVVKGFNEWSVSWKKNGWRKRENNYTGYSSPIANVEYWKQLDTLREGVCLRWVKGHMGDFYNELADKLVRQTYAEVYGGDMTY